SHAVNAIICLDLHTDLILGLEFLVRNKIVVDAHLRYAIAKESGYGLLNPPDPKTVQQTPLRSPQMGEAAFLVGLRLFFWSSQLDLQTLRKFKEMYADCFPSDILHVKDLPKDVFHHIKLLPGAPPISVCILARGLRASPAL
ncbi:hypothetical protein L208DRAFT_1296224, partial [Tricholoma matsutake]